MDDTYGVELPRTKLWLIAAAFGCAIGAMYGCALQMPEAKFEPDGAEHQFPGIYSVLSNDRPSRLIWIHGMCHHDAQWAQERAARVAELLGAKHDPASFSTPELVPETSVEIYSGDLQTTKGNLRLQMVVWSSLTVNHKRALCNDAKQTEQSQKICGIEYTYKYPRATINNALKTDLMNGCLADAILYVGARGVGIRQAMVRTVCHVAGGSYKDGGCVGGGRTDLVNSPLVLVAESLGSKMLIDAMLALKQTSEGHRVLQQSFGQTRMIYLLANQIPMLDLAEREDSATRLVTDSGLRGLVETIRPTHRDKKDSAWQLFVVAFTDPNDLLSYRLEKDYFKGRDDVKVANVLSSNSPTILNLVENPGEAHTGYTNRKAAAVAFACGNIDDKADCPAR
jgi:hypothetical protein